MPIDFRQGTLFDKLPYAQRTLQFCALSEYLENENKDYMPENFKENVGKTATCEDLLS